MSEIMKNILLWVFLGVFLAGTLFSVISNFSSQPEVEEIGFSEFKSKIESDQIARNSEIWRDRYEGKFIDIESMEPEEIEGEEEGEW